MNEVEGWFGLRVVLGSSGPRVLGPVWSERGLLWAGVAGLARQLTFISDT